MKKIIKTILAAVIACTCCIPAVGCDGLENTNQSSSGSTLANNEVLFADFETWAPDFQLCRISNMFGKVSMNADAQYVHEGKRSARIDPVGKGWMYFALRSELFDYDYTDFTRVDGIRMEMYNPQESEETVNVGLVSNPFGLEKFDKAGGKAFTLKPGWNTIDYYVDTTLVCMIADLQDIQGIYFTFDPVNAYEITEETPRFYLDSIRLRYRNEPHVIESNLEFDENEIMDFEKFYQANFFLNEFVIDMQIVKTSDYGIGDASGTKALRMVIPGTKAGGWNYYFEMPGPYLRKSALGNLTTEQFEDAYFAWDVYNASDVVFNMVAVFENGSGKMEYKVASFPKCAQWSTFRVKLTDIEAGMPGWKEDIGNFALSVLDTESVDREIFLDNFRIEFEE